MGNMSDNLMKHEVSSPCPGCGTVNKIRLEQFQRSSSIRCRGCGRTIRLENKGNGLQETKRAMDELERTLKRFK
jgi:hypothetical protein